MRTFLDKQSIKRFALGAISAVVLVGALSACGSSGGHRGSDRMSTENQVKMREKLVDRVSSKLDLNTEQKAKLVTLAEVMQTQRSNLMGQTDPRAEIAAVVAGDKFDRVKAQNLINEKTAVVSKQSPATVTAMADFYDSLNTTQQAKVREFMQRRKGWRN
jgi:periplasmic protein CpxP/Spy